MQNFSVYLRILAESSFAHIKGPVKPCSGSSTASQFQIFVYHSDDQSA